LVINENYNICFVISYKYYPFLTLDTVSFLPDNAVCSS